jgi:NhaP-type Na+/H+ or K+/H+ antiporter
MNKKSFFRNIGTVLMFSFVGTFVAIFSSSAMFYLFGKWFPDNIAPEFTLRESFAFGSLISATDPVSVLAIFKELNADENLYAIVFGESIFNDAIGIVMYETVRGLGKDEDSGMAFQVWEAIVQFNVIFIGSILIGGLSALFVAFI